MICFYHNDNDGKCAGAIVKGCFHDCRMIAIDYKDTFPFESIEKDEQVFIVDFSLQKEGEFKKLFEITEFIVWIDHHKTAIEKHKDFDFLEGIRRTDKSGCELTAEWFIKDGEMAEVIKLIGDWDTWGFKYGDRTHWFNAGLQLLDLTPTIPYKDSVWEKLFFDKNTLNKNFFIENIIEKGKIIMQANSMKNKEYLSNYGFEVDFEGHKCLACNYGRSSSIFFGKRIYDYDIVISFVFDGVTGVVSLYTEKDIDVSEIAKKYGGGGHPKAAGFQCKKLPFSIIRL